MAETSSSNDAQQSNSTGVAAAQPLYAIAKLSNCPEHLFSTDAKELRALTRQG